MCTADILTFLIKARAFHQSQILLYLQSSFVTRFINYVDFIHYYHGEHSLIVFIPCIKNLLWSSRTNPLYTNPLSLPTDIYRIPVKPSTLQDCMTSPGCVVITQMLWWPWAGCTRLFEGMKKWYLMTMKSRSAKYSDENVILILMPTFMEAVIIWFFIMIFHDFFPYRISYVLLVSTGYIQRTCPVWSILFCSICQCSCRTPWPGRRTLS